MTTTPAPGANEIQWRNIRKVVAELAKFCFGSASESGQISLGAAYTALTTSLTAKDGLSVQLEPLPVAAAVPASEAVPVRDLLLEMGDGVAGAHLNMFGKALKRERWEHIADSVLAARVPVFVAGPAPVSGMPEETMTLAEVWAAAGGNPGIKPSRQDVIDALKIMDEAVDECDAKHSAKEVSGMPDLAKLHALASRLDKQLAEILTHKCYPRLLITEILASIPAPQAPDTPVAPKKWMPNPANVNALPPGLREYVHDLQTLCDPQYLVQQVTFLTDQCDMLQRALVLARKPDVDVEAERASFDLGTAPVCSKCHGEGVTHTGIEESPTAQCGKCDGTGLATLPAAPAPTRNTTFGLDDNGKQVLNNAAEPTDVEQLSQRLVKMGVTNFGFTSGSNPNATPEQIAAAISGALDQIEAAPAQTRTTTEQESEIDVAVKAGRITFEPGWDDPRPAPAPTTPSTLGQQVARAKAEMATWPSELRASVRLEGGDAAVPTEPPEHETIVREGNMLTCTACGTSKKMADPCAAPTEQAGELPPLPDLDSLADIEYAQATPEDWDTDYRSTWQKLQLAERNKMQWRAYALQLRAALAARQTPAKDEFEKMMRDVDVTHIACMMGNMIYNLAQKKGHILTAADCEMFNNLREQWDAARQAPDSRDARQIADLILGNEGMRITSGLESRAAFGDDIEHRFEIGDGISRTGVVITLTKLRAPKSTAVLAQEKAQ